MKTQVPEDLAPLSAEALAELEAALVAEFDEAYDNDGSMELLGEVANALDAVREAQAQREAAEAEEAEKRQALADRVRPTATDDAADDGDDDTDEATAESDDTTEDEPADEATAEDEPVDEPEQEKELVTASAKQRKPASAKAVARRTPKPEAPKTPEHRVVITAGADVPGYGNGQEIDRLDIARAMHARARGMGDSKGRQTVMNVASIAKPIPSDHWVKAGEDDVKAVIDRAVSEGMGGKDASALVASGGFCAPSETMYDLFSVESRDGLLDLPTVGVSRGGVNVPDYIGLDAVSSGIWSWDETLDTDGVSTKPCVAIPCPGFTEVRLEAEGLCVTAGNLTDRAYPELTARTVDLAVTAHLHALSNAKIAKIVASATAVTVATVPSDAAGDILNAIDLQVADYRSQFLLGEGTVLDAILPHWYYGAIRSTLAMRAGISELAVTDQQVREFFTVRNVRPQFVYGYEPLFNTSPATAWPGTSKFVLFPTGGYVAGDGGTLDLGVVRDSTLNATNDFTAAWAEAFYSVMKLGPAAREVTVTVAVDGQTGGPEFLGA
jgi:hypothetical protein